MARALRLQRLGGRYHITAGGNKRKAIFRDDRDHFHFLELHGEVGERFAARVHAYVLMDNHYHLLLETPETNLSRAMHWLNAGISALEKAKGQSWRDFADRHGDWGRDAALWLGRRAGRLGLAEFGKLAGSLDYAVVSKAITRFGQRLVSDAALSEQLSSVENQLS